MQIEVRGDRVVIDGYVNAVGRDSRPIRCQTGDFVEQVEPGVFGKALKRAKNIKLLLNHRTDRELGSTADGNLTLTEDSIGLRAHAEIGDEEVIRKARNHQLSGWSFGMYVNESEMEQRSNAIPRRKLKDIDMFEVSVIDTTMLPCYAGTSVECRAEGENAALLETRAYDDAVEVTEKLSENYFDDAERQLAQLRAESDWLDAEKRLEELRYNPYHDPTNGRFTTSSGGGGGYLFVGKGEKGKGSYVFDASGKDSSSKLRNMSDEQREDFMAAYNLSGNEFKENHTPNQAYNAAIEHYQSISKNFTDKIPRSENSMAVKGMEFLQQKISEEKYLQRKKRHEELRQEYLKLLPKNADGKFERQITNLMSVSNEALERKIQMLKSGQNRAEPVNSVFNAEKYLAQLRAESDWLDVEKRLEELRYNPEHG
nr:MAG TPA: prohead serine protease [Caudoviricetes sp.]